MMLISITVIAPMVTGYYLNEYFHFQVINIPLHSALEVSGGVIAIVISILFYVKYQRSYTLNHFNYTGIALLAMGITDIFHGIVLPGEIFVWLHSCAVFFGGLFFLTVWLKTKKVTKRTYKFFPIFVVCFAVLFSLTSIIFPSMVPTMFNEDKSFSLTTQYLNIIGGIGFFIAALKFLRIYICIKEILMNYYLQG